MAVGVLVGVGVAVEVLVGVAVGVLVEVGVAVAVRVGVGVRVPVEVGVTVAVAVGVGVAGPGGPTSMGLGPTWSRTCPFLLPSTSPGPPSWMSWTLPSF